MSSKSSSAPPPVIRGASSKRLPSLPSVIRALSVPVAMRSEWHAKAIRKYLEGTNLLFSQLPFAAREILVEAASHEVFRPGEVVVRQKERVTESSRFYIILSGRVGVFVKESDGGDGGSEGSGGDVKDVVGKLVAVLDPGAAVGEKAMLEHAGVRTATLLAQEHTDMVAVVRDDFLRAMAISVAQQKRAEAQRAALLSAPPTPTPTHSQAHSDSQHLHRVPTAVRMVAASRKKEGGGSDHSFTDPSTSTHHHTLLPSLSFSLSGLTSADLAPSAPPKHPLAAPQLSFGSVSTSSTSSSHSLSSVPSSPNARNFGSALGMSWRDPASSSVLQIGASERADGTPGWEDLVLEEVDEEVEERGEEDDDEDELGVIGEGESEEEDDEDDEEDEEDVVEIDVDEVDAVERGLREKGKRKRKRKRKSRGGRGKSVRFSVSTESPSSSSSSSTLSSQRGSSRRIGTRMRTASRLLRVLSRLRKRGSGRKLLEEGEKGGKKSDGSDKDGGGRTLAPFAGMHTPSEAATTFNPSAIHRVLKIKGELRSPAELDYLAALLGRFASVGSLPTTALRALGRKLQVCTYESGEVIRSEGTKRTEEAVFILTGNVAVFALTHGAGAWTEPIPGERVGAFGRKLMELGPGDAFGEECLSQIVHDTTEHSSGTHSLSSSPTSEKEATESVTLQVAPGIGMVLAAVLTREDALEALSHEDVKQRLQLRPGDATAITALSTMPAHRSAQELGTLESLARELPCLADLPKFARRRLCERWEYAEFAPGEIVHEWCVGDDSEDTGEDGSSEASKFARGPWEGKGSVLFILSGTTTVHRSVRTVTVSPPSSPTPSSSSSSSSSSSTAVPRLSIPTSAASTSKRAMAISPRDTDAVGGAREPLGVLASLAMARKLVSLAAERTRMRNQRRRGRVLDAFRAAAQSTSQRRAQREEARSTGHARDEGVEGLEMGGGKFVIGTSELIRAGNRVLEGMPAWPTAASRAKARGLSTGRAFKEHVATEPEERVENDVDRRLNAAVGPAVAWYYAGDCVGADEDALLSAEAARAQAIAAATAEANLAKRKRRSSLVGRVAAATHIAKPSLHPDTKALVRRMSRKLEESVSASSTSRSLLAASFRWEASLGLDEERRTEEEGVEEEKKDEKRTKKGKKVKEVTVRSRTLVARTKVRAVRVSLATYETVLVASGMVDAFVHAPVAAAVALRKPPHMRLGDELRRLAEWLAVNVSFLRALTPANVLRLCRVVTFRSYPQNKVLIRQGDPADEFFMVLRGKVHAHKRDARSVLAAADARLAHSDAERRRLLLTRSGDTAAIASGGPSVVDGITVGPRVLTFSAGDSFGHAAIEGDASTRRNASVVSDENATNPCEVAVVARDAYRHLVALADEEDEEDEAEGEVANEADASYVGGIFDPQTGGGEDDQVGEVKSNAKEEAFGGKDPRSRAKAAAAAADAKAKAQADANAASVDGSSRSSESSSGGGKGKSGGHRTRGLGNVSGLARTPSLAIAILVKPPSARTSDDLATLNRLLSRLAFLRQLPPESQEAIGRRLQYRRARTGQLIIAEGDDANEFFVLLSGICAVHVRGSPLPLDSTSSTSIAPDPSFLGQRVARLLPGDSFGESALGPTLARAEAEKLAATADRDAPPITSSSHSQHPGATHSSSSSTSPSSSPSSIVRRNASVMALTTTELLVLSAEDLADVLGTRASQVEFQPRLLQRRLRAAVAASHSSSNSEALSAEGGEGSLGSDDLRAARLQLLSAAAKRAVGFSAMGPVQFQRAVKDARYERLPTGSVIYLVGDRAERVFAILEGEVEMLSGRPSRQQLENAKRGHTRAFVSERGDRPGDVGDDGTAAGGGVGESGTAESAALEMLRSGGMPRQTAARLATLSADTFLGEVEIIGGLPSRVTSAITRAPTRLLSIRASTFMACWPRPLLDAVSRRWDLLAGLPGMSLVAHRTVADLYYLASARVLPRGAILTRQGQPAPSILILESGTCSVDRSIVVPRGAAPGARRLEVDMFAGGTEGSAGGKTKESGGGEERKKGDESGGGYYDLAAEGLRPPPTLATLRSTSLADARRREALTMAESLARAASARAPNMGAKKEETKVESEKGRRAAILRSRVTPRGSDRSEENRRAIFTALGLDSAYTPRIDASKLSGRPSTAAARIIPDEEPFLARPPSSSTASSTRDVRIRRGHLRVAEMMRKQRKMEEKRRVSVLLQPTPGLSETDKHLQEMNPTGSSSKKGEEKRSEKSVEDEREMGVGAVEELGKWIEAARMSVHEEESNAEVMEYWMSMPAVRKAVAAFRELYGGDPDPSALRLALQKAGAAAATAIAHGNTAGASYAARMAIEDALAPGAVVVLPIATAVRGACFGAESLVAASGMDALVGQEVKTGEDDMKEGGDGEKEDGDGVVVTGDQTVLETSALDPRILAADTVRVSSARAVVLAVSKSTLARMLSWHAPAQQLLASLRELARTGAPWHSAQTSRARSELRAAAGIEESSRHDPHAVAARAAGAARARTAAHVVPRDQIDADAVTSVRGRLISPHPPPLPSSSSSSTTTPAPQIADLTPHFSHASAVARIIGTSHSSRSSSHHHHPPHPPLSTQLSHQSHRRHRPHRRPSSSTSTSRPTSASSTFSSSFSTTYSSIPPSTPLPALTPRQRPESAALRGTGMLPSSASSSRPPSATMSSSSMFSDLGMPSPIRAESERRKRRKMRREKERERREMGRKRPMSSRPRRKRTEDGKEGERGWQSKRPQSAARLMKSGPRRDTSRLRKEEEWALREARRILPPAPPTTPMRKRRGGRGEGVEREESSPVRIGVIRVDDFE